MKEYNVTVCGYRFDFYDEETFTVKAESEQHAKEQARRLTELEYPKIIAEPLNQQP